MKFHFNSSNMTLTIYIAIANMVSEYNTTFISLFLF